MNSEFAKEAEQAIKRMSDRQKSKIKRGKKIYIGQEMRANWTDFQPFYIFWCEDCKKFSKNYPHYDPVFYRLQCNFCGMSEEFFSFKEWFRRFFRRNGNIYEIAETTGFEDHPKDSKPPQ